MRLNMFVSYRSSVITALRARRRSLTSTQNKQSLLISARCDARCRIKIVRKCLTNASVTRSPHDAHVFHFVRWSTTSPPVARLIDVERLISCIALLVLGCHAVRLRGGRLCIKRVVYMVVYRVREVRTPAISVVMA